MLIQMFAHIFFADSGYSAKSQGIGLDAIGNIDNIRVLSCTLRDWKALIEVDKFLAAAEIYYMGDMMGRDLLIAKD